MVRPLSRRNALGGLSVAGAGDLAVDKLAEPVFGLVLVEKSQLTLLELLEELFLLMASRLSSGFPKSSRSRPASFASPVPFTLAGRPSRASAHLRMVAWSVVVSGHRHSLVTAGKTSLHPAGSGVYPFCLARQARCIGFGA